VNRRRAIAVVFAAVLVASCGGSGSASRTAAPHAAQPAARAIATGLQVPWGIAFLPGGDALVSERTTGRIVRVPAAGGAVQPVMEVPGVDTNAGEGGLLGLAISPTYARDRLVYAYFTSAQDNRVVRFTLGGAPQPVLTGLDRNAIHDGGRIAFGPDRMLYVGTGDAGNGPVAQDPESLNGKILRLRPDGGIPGDNPFRGSPVWSVGHRNVQGLAWDRAGRLWEAELGQDRFDEVNLIRPGRNYGWPRVEGKGATNGGRYTNPLVRRRRAARRSPAARSTSARCAASACGASRSTVRPRGRRSRCSTAASGGCARSPSRRTARCGWPRATATAAARRRATTTGSSASRCRASASLGRMSATASRPKIRPLDPLDLDGLLSDEDRLIAETVRRFAADRVLPQIEEWYEQGTLPTRDLAPAIGELGLLGMHLSGYGCAGASATSYGVACRELEAADSGLRSFVSVQGSLAMFPIWKFGSDEQKERWLPGMAAGELIGCFGLTEPDSGSDPSSMKCNAKRDGSDWVLNGAKMWITNGGVADVAVVWARTDDGIRGFLVPRDTPGFTTQDIHRKHSLRASITSELVFDDVRLPEDAVLPGVTGMRGPLSCLSEARYGILWGTVGAARTCLDAALEYSKSRPQFGRPIAAFQLTQQKLVNMMLELQKAQLLALHVGRLKDEGRVAPEHISIGKLNNVREALAIAREARTILGANGISSEYPVMRHAENLESVLTYEGTSEIHTLILGQAMTGESAFT
jgi:glutaryl-CoA dehydrogenase